MAFQALCYNDIIALVPMPFKARLPNHLLSNHLLANFRGTKQHLGNSSALTL
jgi:hypothetical protein